MGIFVQNRFGARLRSLKTQTESEFLLSILCPNRLRLYQTNADPKTFRCSDKSNHLWYKFLTLALSSRLAKSKITTCVRFGFDCRAGSTDDCWIKLNATHACRCDLLWLTTNVRACGLSAGETTFFHSRFDKPKIRIWTMACWRVRSLSPPPPSAVTSVDITHHWYECIQKKLRISLLTATKVSTESVRNRLFVGKCDPRRTPTSCVWRQLINLSWGKPGECITLLINLLVIVRCAVLVPRKSTDWAGVPSRMPSNCFGIQFNWVFKQILIIWVLTPECKKRLNENSLVNTAVIHISRLSSHTLVEIHHVIVRCWPWKMKKK